MKKTTVKETVSEATPERKHPQIELLTKALETFCVLTDQELCPSQDLCEHAAFVRTLLNRDSGRPRKQDQIDLILYYSGRGWTVKQIVEATQIPTTTVRRHFGRKAAEKPKEAE